MKRQKFKRGQRVRYVGSNAHFSGQTGTITGYDAMGWLRVRFDSQQPYEKGIRWGEVGLELYDGPPSCEPTKELPGRYTDAETLAIVDAISNSDMDSEMRIRILDRLQ